MFRVQFGSGPSAVYSFRRNSQQEVSFTPRQTVPDQVLFGQRPKPADRHAFNEMLTNGARVLDSAMRLAGRPGSDISVPGILGQLPRGPLKDLFVALFLFSGDSIKQVGAGLEIDDVQDENLRRLLRERFSELGYRCQEMVRQVGALEMGVKMGLATARSEADQENALLAALNEQRNSDATAFAVARLFTQQSQGDLISPEVQKQVIERFISQRGVSQAVRLLLLGTQTAESLERLEPYVQEGAKADLTKAVEQVKHLDELKNDGFVHRVAADAAEPSDRPDLNGYVQFVEQNTYRLNTDVLGTLVLLNAAQVLPDGQESLDNNAYRIANEIVGNVFAYKTLITLAGMLIGTDGVREACWQGCLDEVVQYVSHAATNNDLLQEIAKATADKNPDAKLAELQRIAGIPLQGDFPLGAYRFATR
jgi:hypothetical protein